MKLLLDTHALLWLFAADPRLPSNTLGLIKDPANAVFLSVASAWEIAIKASLNRLTIGVTLGELLTQFVPRSGISVLPIEVAHVLAVSQLPYHHGDPFDRMIIAQALEESMEIVSADQALDAYGTLRCWT